MKTKEFTTVEIPLEANGTEFTFNNEKQLQDAKKVVAIQAVHAGNVAKTPGQKPVCNAAAFNTAYLTVNDLVGNKEVVKHYPLRLLNSADNAGKIQEFDLGKIDPSKCKVTFGNPALVVTGEFIVLFFHFEK